MGKFLILLVLFCTVLVCSGGGKAKKSGGGKSKKSGGGCEEKNIRAYKKCLKQGFVSSLGCDSPGSGNVKGKLLKKCTKIEKKLTKCAYTCVDDWQWGEGVLAKMDPNGRDLLPGGPEGLAILFLINTKNSTKQFGTVCSDHFNDHAADLYCQDAGFHSAISWGSHALYQYVPSPTITAMNLRIVADDIRCAPEHSSIKTCDAKFMDHNCEHEKDVWIKCFEGQGECPDENEHCAYWAEIGECEANPGYMLKSCRKSCNACDKDGGSSADWKFQEATLFHMEEGGRDLIPGDEGLVALKFINKSDGEMKMGTLCSDHFNDHAADLSCQYLGYDKATSWGNHTNYKYVPKAVLENYDVPVVVDYVKCEPKHSNITECDVKIMDHNCDHDKDVWIKCFTEKRGNALTVKLPNCVEVHHKVKLESWDFAYAEEPFRGERLEINLLKQDSVTTCTLDDTFGLKDHVVWVNNGCRGDFEVEVKICTV